MKNQRGDGETKFIGRGRIVESPQTGKFVFYLVVPQRFPAVGTEVCAVLGGSAAICAKHIFLLEHSISLTDGFDLFDFPMAVFSL